MSNLIPIDQARALAPAKMRERMAQGQGMQDRFQGGVSTPPMLSIRGKNFRIREDDDEIVARDPNTNLPLGALDVVLVNSSPHVAKTFYARPFSAGDTNPPDCWSMDSIRPDPSIPQPVNPTCADCPNNSWGSKVLQDGRQGSRAKACSDSKRVVVTWPTMLTMPNPKGYLLRVPATSLKPLNNYIRKLASFGFEPGGCITRLSFEDAEYPLLSFQFVCPLNDQEFDTVLEMVKNPQINGMLQLPEFDTGTVQNKPATGLQALPRQAQVIEHDVQKGFAPGMLTQAAQHPTPQEQMDKQAQTQAAPKLHRMPDGRLLDLTTNTYVEEKAPAPAIDPGIHKMPDGRFLRLFDNTFVEGPFVGAKEVAEKPKVTRTRVKLEPKEEPVQEAAQEATPAIPDDVKPDKPMVVAASPKLEQLLGNLTPKKNGS